MFGIRFLAAKCVSTAVFHVIMLVLMSTLMMSTSAQAAELLFTDFDNSGVTGGAMTGVVWTESGLTAQTTLSATSDVRAGLTGDADAEGGYFSPDANVNGSTEISPAWSTTWTITVGTLGVMLDDIVLASAETNSGGLLGLGNGDSVIRLEIEDNATSTVIADLDQVRDVRDGTSQDLTYTTPLALTANQTYDVTFSVWESPNTSQGHFEAFDSVTFNGNVVPEPASLAMGLVGLGLAVWRRRG